MAFDFSDSIALNTKVFAYQPENLQNGGQRYVVATLKDFWIKYSQMPEEKRHFYEVIREKNVSSIFS